MQGELCETSHPLHLEVGVEDCRDHRDRFVEPLMFTSL